MRRSSSERKGGEGSRAKRSSSGKVHITNEVQSSSAPPSTATGGAARPPKVEAKAKSLGVLNNRAHASHESTISKFSDEVDVRKHDQHSGALAAFLDMLGIQKNDQSVRPANASAGAVARERASGVAIHPLSAAAAV